MKRVLSTLSLLLLGSPAIVLASPRTVIVPRASATTSSPVRLECPVNKVTRIIIVKPFRRLVVKPPTAVDPLGIAVLASKPEGIVRIQPSRHPVSGEMHIQVEDRLIVLALRTTAQGAAAEIRLVPSDASAGVSSPLPISGKRASLEPAPSPSAKRPAVPIAPPPIAIPSISAATSQPIAVVTGPSSAPSLVPSPVPPIPSPVRSSSPPGTR